MQNNNYNYPNKTSDTQHLRSDRIAVGRHAWKIFEYLDFYKFKMDT